MPVSHSVRAPALHRLVDRGLVELLVRPGDRGEDDVGHLSRPAPSPSRPAPGRRRCSPRTPRADRRSRSCRWPPLRRRRSSPSARGRHRRRRTPLPPTRAPRTTPMILIRFMLLPSFASMALVIPDRSGFHRSRALLPHRGPVAGRADGPCSTRSGRFRSRSICSTPRMIRSPETNMPPDDDEPEDDELQGGRQAHHPHHLGEPGEEERRRPRRERAGQPAGERGPADDHRGDRTEQVRRADGDARRTQERRPAGCRRARRGPPPTRRPTPG